MILGSYTEAVQARVCSRCSALRSTVSSSGGSPMMLAPSLLYCVRLPRRKLFHFIFSTAGESFVPRFSANLSWLFTELPMLARFDAAANAGFAAVEIAFPYLHSPKELRHRLQ